MNEAILVFLFVRSIQLEKSQPRCFLQKNSEIINLAVPKIHLNGE